jgi:hypothetical protein
MLVFNTTGTNLIFECTLRRYSSHISRKFVDIRYYQEATINTKWTSRCFVTCNEKKKGDSPLKTMAEVAPITPKKGE